MDEYLAWAEGRPGRYELHAGVVYAMAPERAVHARVKYAVQTALSAGIERAKLPCEMLPDGMTIRIDKHTAHEPDALVYCGGKVAGDSLEVSNPLIVVEVLSPSTRRVDASAKLAGYFTVPSVHHYLIVDPNEPLVIHHERSAGEAIATRIFREGMIRLDPPGCEIDLSEIYKSTT